MRRKALATILVLLLVGACGGSNPGGRPGYSPAQTEQTGTTIAIS